MAFHNVQFPADISYGSRGGPQYSTDIVVTYGGHEQRNVNWAASRARYNVAHGVRTKTQLETLIAFFRARKGRAHSFRFKDWTDYQAVNQWLATGNGSLNSFQLMRHYISGGVTESRIVTLPVNGTLMVYVNGTLQSGATLDAQTGMVTLASAPASGANVTADFEFDVPVRFDTDQLSATLENYGVHSWMDIPLIEVRH